MPTATMTTKGQITIPKEIRDQLRLVPGDRLDFVVDDESGELVLRPARGTARQLYGMITRRGLPPATPARMDQEIAEVVAEDNQRTRQQG